MKPSNREQSSNISYIYHIVLGMSSETSSKMSLSNTKIYFLLVTPYRFHILKMLIFRTQVDNFLRRYVPIHITPFPTSLIHQSTFTSTVVHRLCAPVSQSIPILFQNPCTSALRSHTSLFHNPCTVHELKVSYTYRQQATFRHIDRLK